MAVSLADEAYLAIRDEMLRGQLGPGTPLSRRRLARQLGMSVLPVSDALKRLEEDGLVETRARAGTRVKVPTRTDVRELYELREALETQAARLFAERGFHGTSMGDLAQAMGVQKGSLYSLTDSKQRLLHEAMAAGAAAFHKALDALWQVIGAANRYVDEQKPWSLKRSDPARMNTVLYVLAEVIRHLATLAQPFMPDSCARLLDFLAVPGDRRTFASLGSATVLTPGASLPAPEGIFPRYVEAGEGAAGRT